MPTKFGLKPSREEQSWTSVRRAVSGINVEFKAREPGYKLDSSSSGQLRLMVCCEHAKNYVSPCLPPYCWVLAWLPS
jgi:hypothetical protein